MMIRASKYFFILSILITSYTLICIHYINILKKEKNKKSNVVIVLSRGYSNNNLYPFFKTLRKQSPDSYLLIFSENKTIDYAKEIYNNNGKIIGIEFQNDYPFYPTNHYRYPISFRFLEKEIPSILNKKLNFFFHTIRFFLINVWLMKYGDEFKSVLLCDIKDIMFQNDPFTYYNESGLFFQQEVYIREGKKGIKADDLNYEWIKPYHPNEEILLNPIINSGQILGNSKEVTRFVSEFCNFMEETHINTAEQASLNYFLYSHKFKGKYISKKHEYGYALLLHYTLPRTKDNFTPINNYFYNYDGTIPPIIHAYHLGFIFGSYNRKKKYREFINYHNK